MLRGEGLIGCCVDVCVVLVYVARREGLTGVVLVYVARGEGLTVKNLVIWLDKLENWLSLNDAIVTSPSGTPVFMIGNTC